MHTPPLPSCVVIYAFRASAQALWLSNLESFAFHDILSDAMVDLDSTPVLNRDTLTSLSPLTFFLTHAPDPPLMPSSS